MKIFLTITLLLTGVVMKIHSPPGKLDTRPYYTVFEAENFFTSLQTEQINDYLICEFFDLWFLINYSLLGFLLARHLFKKKWKFALFLPALFDLWETVSIILKLEQINISLSLLALSSTLKWLSGGIVVFYVLFRVYQAKKSIDA